MSTRFQMYLSEEDEDEKELIKWIEEFGDVVGGESKLLKLAVIHMRDEKGEALRALKPEEEDEFLI